MLPDCYAEIPFDLAQGKLRSFRQRLVLSPSTLLGVNSVEGAGLAQNEKLLHCGLGPQRDHMIFTGPMASRMARKAGVSTVAWRNCSSGYCRWIWMVRKLPRRTLESWLPDLILFVWNKAPPNGNSGLVH